MCARPSPERTVTRTARKAGADTDGGSSEPPARIENVAGTRALTDPPAGCLEALGVAPPLADVLVVGLTEAPPLPDVVVLGADPDLVLDVVKPDVEAEVEAEVDGEVAGAVDAVEWAEVEAPVLELEDFPPPHPPIASRPATSASSLTARLTAPA
jgi:hypothetical protein